MHLHILQIRNMENGILIKTEDKAALIEAMTKISEDEKLAERLGENAISIRKQLSAEKIADEWMQLFENGNR